MITSGERTEYVGKSTDTKPVENVKNGSEFYEMDTKRGTCLM